MAEVVVVGAGLAGMAVAARLAKLGHRVTVTERAERPGGRLQGLEHQGFGWDSEPTGVALPAVLRDLFRKSGRPLERYISLELRAPARRHLFADGSVVDLPTGSRAAQTEAVDCGLGAGAGREWTGFVDGQAEEWNRRRLGAGGPDGGVGAFGSVSGDADVTGRAGRGSLGRASLETVLRASLADPRLRELAGSPFELKGFRLGSVPASRASDAYVERSFGLWTVPGGLGALVDALATRLAERKVELRRRSDVRLIETDGRRVRGVVLADGSRVPADLVVAAVDPLAVFSGLLGRRRSRAARVFRSAARVPVASVVHLGLRGENPAGFPHDLVVHGDPVVLVETAGRAPAGHRAWTVRCSAGTDVDVLALMARRGLDVRDQVVVRLDHSRDELRSLTGEVADPLGWDSARAQRRRAACARPLSGLYVVAAPLAPGATIAEVAWTAAHVATAIGKA